MKTQASLEIRTCIDVRINLNFSGSQTHTEFCQIHRTAAVFKTLVVRWHKKFQVGFTNTKLVPVLVSPKLLLSMLILLMWHCVGILAGSAHKILAQQLKLRMNCARCAPPPLPYCLIKEQKSHLYENAHLFFYKMPNCIQI